MANICSNYIEISGDQTQLNQLRKRIKEQDESLLEDIYFLKQGDFYGLVQDSSEIDDEGDIELDCTSKWSPPEEALSKLSALYPLLCIKVRYQEPACDAYGTLEYQDGKCILDTPMDQESYLEEYDETYKELIKDIAESDYKDFTFRYMLTMVDLQDNPETFDYPNLLERKILERVKDEDLPLLVGYTWFSKVNQTEFEKRIKGVKAND